MADTEEGFGLPSTPVDSEAKELQAEAKQDPQLGTTSKAPTSPQAAFTQQVRSGPQPPLPPPPLFRPPLSFFAIFLRFSRGPSCSSASELGRNELF